MSGKGSREVQGSIELELCTDYPEKECLWWLV